MNKGPCCVPRGEGGSPSLLSHCGGRAEPRDGAEGRAGVLQARSPHGPRQHVARTGRTAQGFQHIPCLPHSTRTGHTRGRRSLGRRIRGGRRTQSMRGGAPRGETAQTHRPRGRAAHAAGFRVHFVSGGLPEPSVSSGFCQSHARKMQASAGLLRGPAGLRQRTQPLRAPAPTSLDADRKCDFPETGRGGRGRRGVAAGRTRPHAVSHLHRPPRPGQASGAREGEGSG